MDDSKTLTHPAAGLRVSTQDREQAVDRLQAAFLAGRLTDAELGERIDHALSARVGADLDAVLGDLPADPSPVVPDPREPHGTPAALRWVAAHKGAVTQAGRWTVPARFKSFSYKATQTLDLTRAHLTAPRTEIRITAYKSTVEVIVPPGVRVEVRGLSFRGSWNDETGGGSVEGPVLVIKGFAYKGTVLIRM